MKPSRAAIFHRPRFTVLDEEASVERLLFIRPTLAAKKEKKQNKNTKEPVLLVAVNFSDRKRRLDEDEEAAFFMCVRHDGCPRQIHLPITSVALLLLPFRFLFSLALYLV